VPLTVTMSFSYDEGGRITNFNGNNYSYTGSSIHGVSSITGNTSKSFSYDANGNQDNSDGRVLTYSAFNKTTHMEKGVSSVDFVYGSNNNRIKRVDVGNDENETTYYIGNVELYYDNNHNFIKSKRYIGNTVITQYDATNTREVKYLHKDHLGSIQSVTNEVFSAISTEHLSYDAFGRRRDASNNSLIINYNPIANVTKKGFTGQEHIDQLGVINFNARLYDPELGIMLQADTIIPDGPVTQSLNRYSYVFNNPLSYTDPTGHAAIWSLTFEQDIVENAAKQARFFEGVRERNTQKEAENSKSDDAKIETPVGGANNGTFGGNSNGLGGGSFNGKDLNNINNRYNGSDNNKNRNDVSFRTGPNIRQGKFGSHTIANPEDVPTLWEATKGVASFFDPTEAFRGCVSNGCGAGYWMLAATEFVPWGKLFGKARKFKNNFPDDPVFPVPQNQLINRNGKWLTQSPNGNTWTASGRYNFIAQGDDIFLTNKGGHIDLSRGIDVDFAGEVFFSGRTNRGILKSWNNNSGHYTPSFDYSNQANLPIELFKNFE